MSDEVSVMFVCSQANNILTEPRPINHSVTAIPESIADIQRGIHSLNPLKLN